MATCAVAISFAIPAVAADQPTRLRQQVQQRQTHAFRHAAGPRAADLPVEPQIVGGKIAPPGAWPSQVALLDAGVGNNALAQFCGGSLISAKHILTAAHCVDGMRPSELHILTGTQSLRSGGTRRQVASIRVHPRYSDATSDYDVAVVTMKTAAIGTRTVQMLSPTSERILAKPGTLAVVTGWGSLDAAGNRYPNVLYQVNVPIVSTTICNRPQSYDGEITPRMICAGYAQGGKDACSGDSGGPLLVRDGTGHWRLQAGIVSFGEGCARRNFYGVYARAAVLRTWVMTVVNSRLLPRAAALAENPSAVSR